MFSWKILASGRVVESDKDVWSHPKISELSPISSFTVSTRKCRAAHSFLGGDALHSPPRFGKIHVIGYSCTGLRKAYWIITKKKFGLNIFLKKHSNIRCVFLVETSFGREDVNVTNFKTLEFMDIGSFVQHQRQSLQRYRSVAIVSWIAEQNLEKKGGDIEVFILELCPFPLVKSLWPQVFQETKTKQVLSMGTRQ